MRWIWGVAARMDPMTDEMMTLRSMLENGTVADRLPEMIGFAADRPMELEVQGLCARFPDGQTTATTAMARPSATISSRMAAG